MDSSPFQSAAGHRYVSMQQILATDQQFWLRIAQESRGKLSADATGFPLDPLLDKYMYAADVVCYMTPLPAPKPEAHKPLVKQNPVFDKKKGKGKGQTKSAYESKGSGKSIRDLLTSMPQDCQSKLPNGRFLCLYYNNGICKHQKKKQCQNGFHQCYHKDCKETRPYIECNH